MEPPALTLVADGLLSKWGFNDGGTPDELMDYWDHLGIPYPDIDWHDALRKLVRDHLIPELTKHHEIDVVDMEGIHNPIRALTVDGIKIDGYRSHNKVRLTPAWVTVPYSTIAEACGL
jgi:hypothetical protein